MLGVQAVPSLIFLILIKFIPERPPVVGFKKRGEDVKALAILRIINPLNCDDELKAIKASQKESESGMQEAAISSTGNTAHRYFSLSRLPFLIRFQVSMLLFTMHRAYLKWLARLPIPRSVNCRHEGSSILFFTLIAINIIDKAGIRLLMLIGSIGLISFTAACRHHLL